MYDLIQAFVKLSLLKLNPQDLPDSPALLGLTIFGYAIISMLLALPSFAFSTSLLQVIVDLGVLFGFTFMLLSIRAYLYRYRLPMPLTAPTYRYRWMQTMTALIGTGVVFGVLAIPLASILRQPADDNSLAVVISLLLASWVIVVYGHIYRHALSISLGSGMLTSFSYIVLNSLIIESLFPLPKT